MSADENKRALVQGDAEYPCSLKISIQGNIGSMMSSTFLGIFFVPLLMDRPNRIYLLAECF